MHRFRTFTATAALAAVLATGLAAGVSAPALAAEPGYKALEFTQYSNQSGFEFAIPKDDVPVRIDIAARMFSPGMGLGEDPATGGAAAALIGLLAKHGDGGQTELVLRQGYEMGRPSKIMVQFRKENDELVHGGIGGHAVIVGEGSLDLGD